MHRSPVGASPPPTIGVRLWDPKIARAPTTGQGRSILSPAWPITVVPGRATSNSQRRRPSHRPTRRPCYACPLRLDRAIQPRPQRKPDVIGDEQGKFTQLANGEFLVVQHGVDLDLQQARLAPERSTPRSPPSGGHAWTRSAPAMVASCRPVSSEGQANQATCANLVQHLDERALENT